MSEEPHHTEPITKPVEEEVQPAGSPWRTLISLLAFIAVYYWLFHSWLAVLVLVAVIVLHESGHFIAMKLLGYQSLNMTFIPFVGAYVSGRSMDLSRKKKLLVLIAGPLPGLIIGAVLLLLRSFTQQEEYGQLARPFLLLNLFNMLPVYPLDGGQYFQALFTRASKLIQLILLYAGFVLVLYLYFNVEANKFLVLLAALAAWRIIGLHRVYWMQGKLQQAGIDYAATYDDLTDDEYWAIRQVLIRNNRKLAARYDPDQPSADEQEIIRQIEQLLVLPYSDELSTKQQWLFFMLWLTGIALPCMAFLLSSR